MAASAGRFGVGGLSGKIWNWRPQQEDLELDGGRERSHNDGGRERSHNDGGGWLRNHHPNDGNCLLHPFWSQNQLVPCLRSTSRLSGGDHSSYRSGQRTKGWSPYEAHLFVSGPSEKNQTIWDIRKPGKRTQVCPDRFRRKNQCTEAARSS